MSATLTGLKQFLRLTHNEDDALLTALLSGAEDDLLQFLAISDLPDSELVDAAHYMLVRGWYDAETPDDADKWQEIAHRIVWPYREGLGV